MRIMKEPLFIINDDWYYYDKEEKKFKLTEEGIKNKKVRESYEEYYRELEEGEVNDNTSN